MSEKVAAVFDKPEHCEYCPCVHVRFVGMKPVARCMLRVNELMAGWNKESDLDLTVCDIDKITDPIPEWCPLTPLTVIGPAPDMGV